MYTIGVHTCTYIRTHACATCSYKRDHMGYAYVSGY